MFVKRTHSAVVTPLSRKITSLLLPDGVSVPLGRPDRQRRTRQVRTRAAECRRRGCRFFLDDTQRFHGTRRAAGQTGFGSLLSSKHEWKISTKTRYSGNRSAFGQMFAMGATCSRLYRCVLVLCVGRQDFLWLLFRYTDVCRRGHPACKVALWPRLAHPGSARAGISGRPPRSLSHQAARDPDHAHSRLEMSP